MDSAFEGRVVHGENVDVFIVHSPIIHGMLRGTWFALLVLLFDEVVALTGHGCAGFNGNGLLVSTARKHLKPHMAAAKKQKKTGKTRSAAGGFGSPKGGFGSKATPAEIPTLKLNTGAAMPALGFGTYRTEGESLKQALEIAIACGYRHFDTARAYQNEDVVGAAISKSGIPREDFFITSKMWTSDHGEERARLAIEASLKELGTDYIDLYLMHGPGKDTGRDAEEIVELRQQSWMMMEEYHKAGKLRAIGVSNFEPRHVESVLECGTVVPAVNQFEMHAQLSQEELREYCASKGILVEAYGSIGAEGLRADPKVQEIAKVHKRTPAQVSLRHTLQRGVSVIAKSITPKRIAENAQLWDFELSADEVASLDALHVGKRSYWDNSACP